MPREQLPVWMAPVVEKGQHPRFPYLNGTGTGFWKNELLKFQGGAQGGYHVWTRHLLAMKRCIQARSAMEFNGDTIKRAGSRTN